MPGPKFWNWMAPVLLAALGAVWLATADFDLIDQLQFTSGEEAPRIASGREILQTFTPREDNISRIDLVLSKADPGAEGLMKLELIDPAGAVLRQATLDTGTFKHPSISRFELDPVGVARGHKHAIKLTSGDPEESAVEPGSNPKDEYNAGRLYINGAAAGGDLYFATFHSEGFAGMLKKMEPFRPFPLGSAVLIAALFLAGSGAFGWLLKEIARG